MILVVIKRHFYIAIHLVLVGLQKLVKCLKVIFLLILIENKKSISINWVSYHIISWKSTKFKNFKQLIIIISSWEYRNLNEKFDRRATQRPHVYTLIVRWILLVLFINIIRSDQNFRSSIISRLNVGVNLVTIESSTSKIYKFNIQSVIFSNQNILRL